MRTCSHAQKRSTSPPFPRRRTSRDALPLLPFLFLLAIAVPQRVSDGAVTISGTLVTAAEEPLQGVSVRLLPIGLATETDANGRFRFTGLPPGRFELQIRHLGYEPLGFALEIADPDEELELGVIPLKAATPMLEGVVVEGEGVSPRLAATGFYARRDAGLGAFVEREQIESWNPRQVSDILRHVPGVRVEPNPNYGRALQPRRSAFGYAVEPSHGRDTRRVLIYSPRAPNAADCPPLYFVDGVFLGDALTADIDAVYDPTAAEAIEFYAGPGRLPSEFNRPGAQCGVFVFWSRVGR